MLAYVFWHRPTEAVSRDDYVNALRAFHARLAAVPVAGLLGSHSYRVGELPWLPGGGYEDWYLISDFAALESLNEQAVAPRRRPAHDAVAAWSATGAGGLYRLVHGRPATTGVATWFSKPAGMDTDAMTQLLPGPSATMWQRQMVLGPAPEYRVVTAERLELLPLFAPVSVALDPVVTGE